MNVPSVVVPLVLRSVIARKTASRSDLEHAISYAGGMLSVTLGPAVGRRQRDEVLLNEPASPALAAFSFRAPPREADATMLEFDAPSVGAGTYQVRARADGAESPLIAKADGVPTRPQVVVV